MRELPLEGQGADRPQGLGRSRGRDGRQVPQTGEALFDSGQVVQIVPDPRHRHRSQAEELAVPFEGHQAPSHPQGQVLIVDVKDQQTDARRHPSEDAHQERLEGQDNAVADAPGTDDQDRLGDERRRIRDRQLISLRSMHIVSYHCFTSMLSFVSGAKVGQTFQSAALLIAPLPY